jgi:mycothiol system anti-sigma-R factor
MHVPDIGDRFCEKYRQYLDAYLDLALPVETQRDVQQHIASCSECARILDSRCRMKHLVRRAVASEEAPLALVEALRTRLQSEYRVQTGAGCLQSPVAAGIVSDTSHIHVGFT